MTLDNNTNLKYNTNMSLNVMFWSFHLFRLVVSNYKGQSNEV